MKKLLNLLFLFVVVGTLVCCKTANVLPPTIIEKTNTITTKEVVRDTVFKTEKDSSSIKALLECQNGKVVIKSTVKKEKGNFMPPPKLNLKDNILTVDCKAEAQSLFAKWKETYILENQQTITTKPVEVEKPLSFWQKTQLWSGRLFLFILTSFGLLAFLHWKGII